MLSIPHLIIIFLVALIVLGPEKLPEVARTVSKAMIEFRRVTGSMRETLDQEMRQLERDIDERGRPASPATPPHSKPALTSMGDPSIEAENEGGAGPEDAEVFGSRSEETFRGQPPEKEAAITDPAGAPVSESSAPGKPPDGHPTPA